MASLTAIELGADTCALAHTSERDGQVQLFAAETLDPSSFAGTQSFTVGVSNARRAYKFPRRARVVLWGLPDGASRKDAAIQPLLAPLVNAGFKVTRVVTPCNALSALARVRAPRGEGAVCWLAVNRAGVAIVVVRPGKQLYAHSFVWNSNLGASGSQARLLQRYSLVSFLAPQVKRAIAEARKQGTPVEALVTCGNLPDLRSLTMPLIEELDLEVETLDSLEGLIVKPAIAERVAEQAAAIRLACAATLARGTRAVDEGRRRAVHRNTALVRVAALLAGVAAIGFAWYATRRDPTPAVSGKPPVAATQPARTTPGAVATSGPASAKPPVVDTASASASRPGASPAPPPTGASTRSNAATTPATTTASAPTRSNPTTTPAPPTTASAPPRSNPTTTPGSPTTASAPPRSNPTTTPGSPATASAPPRSNPPAVSPATAPSRASEAPARTASAPPRPSEAPTRTAGAPPRASETPARTVTPPPAPAQSKPPAMPQPAPPVFAPAKPPVTQQNSAPQRPGNVPSTQPRTTQSNPPATPMQPLVTTPAPNVPKPQAPPNVTAQAPGREAAPPPPRARVQQTPRPATDKAQANSAVMPKLLTDPMPRITAILVANDRRFATINDGQIVGIGDSLGPRVVVGIEEKAVVLREPSGVQIRVGLGGRLLGVARQDQF